MLLLIDLSHLFWTNWHATANEEVGEAFARTVGAVHRLRGTLASDDRCAVCLDCPPYKRKAVYAEYKSQRDAPEPAATDQFRRVRDRLVADGFLLWGAQGYEADDVIATAVRLAREHQTTVTIATNDKDLLQLVDDAGIKVHSTKTGTLWSEQTVLDKFGVPPRKMRDLLALVGDTSDNIPGVPRIGTKTASELLTKHGSLDVILNWAAAGDPDNLFAPPSIRKALLENIETMKRARDLVTLMTDAPIDWADLEKTRDPEPLTEVQDAEFEDDAPAAHETPKTTPLSDPAKTKEPKENAIVLAPRSQEWALALEPKNLAQAFAIAKCIFNSRMFAVASPEAAMMILLTGRSLGLDAATSMRGVHIIKGKPSLSAALIEGLVLASGKCEYFQIVESTTERATYRTKRIGAPDSVIMSYTSDDSEREGLSKRTASGEESMHTRRPKTMYRWRCAADLARAVYPDVIMGLYVPGELDED
jgi:5'-3' exonuclease